MPPFPKYSNISRKKGEFKICNQIKTAHATKSYGHVRISAEIPIDLKGKENTSQD